MERAWGKRTLSGLVLFAGLLSFVVFVAACGGGNSTTSADAPTKAQFIKTVNAICVKTEAERGKALKTSPLEPLKKKLNAAQLNKVVLEDALPPVRGMVEQLAGLTPPNRGADEVAALIKEYEAALQRSEKDPQTALSGVAFVKVDEKVKAFGLGPSCVI